MALSYETLPGDVDHLIADDHAVVERQFQHLEAGRGDRRVLVDQVSFELALHADAEEIVVYPAMAAAGEPDESEHARQEHHEMKELLVKLHDSQPGEAEFEQTLATLIAAVRHHVAEEEGEFLPRLRQLVGAGRMAELGKEFLAAKRTAPTYPHPKAPSSRAGHKIADPAALVVDKVRDMASGRIKHLATDPSGHLDPQAQRILDAFSGLKPQPFEILTPDQAREQPTPFDAVRRILAEDGRSTDPEPVGSVENVTIPGPGGDLPVRIYKPRDATGPVPVVVWIHGGGWVLFTVDSYDASCRGLVNKTGAIVVSPEYRRAPEHVFPAAHDDVLATFRWVRANAGLIGGDPDRVAIGGESVGGNMAAATCWQLKQANEPLPVAQVLVYPLTTGEQFGDSMTDAADARPLNRPLLSWMAMHAFEGVPDGARDPRVDLLSLDATQLKGLPPALVITDERDVLRSQGEEFARHLQAAGVPTTLTCYDGVMHEFFGAAAVLDKAQRAQQEAAQHLRESFQTGIPAYAG
ncbi:alpha/beta hydrolase fold domain-containing protein [Polymorphospora sp. NPDC050346]|uniref:alpha/beta hydrolase fold domain-containing protein n=1 Tax=Polymorphospora sp. NPDC050346 TaxID=3155780 RepID=UPI0033F36A47